MAQTGKIVFGIALVVGVSMAWKYISEMLNKFRFKVVGYGIPSFSNWVLKLPIVIQFNNPTGVTLKADQVLIDVYMRDAAQQYVHIGNVKQPITLPPGKSDQTVVPSMSLSAVAGTLSSTWQDIISTRSAKIRTDLSVVYQGIKLPPQRYEDVIKV